MRKSLYLQGLRVQVAQRQSFDKREMCEGVALDSSLKRIAPLISQLPTVRRQFGKSHCTVWKRSQNLLLITRRQETSSWTAKGAIRRACAWCQSMALRSHPRDTDQ